MDISIQRIYDTMQNTEGTRILVDRIWPRGISKERTRLYYWWKDVAPSTDLRQWFNHDVDKWEEFRKRYWTELLGKEEAILIFIKSLDLGQSIVLLYSAKDEDHNQAVVLQSFLRKIVI